MVFSTNLYSAAGSSGSPVSSRVTGLLSSGYNWLLKQTGYMSDTYSVGPEAIELYRSVEARLEMHFATMESNTYKKFIDNDDIMHRLADRAAIDWQYMPTWVANGNREQILAFYNQNRINAPPTLRLIAQIYLDQHDDKHPVLVGDNEHGLLEHIQPTIAQAQEDPTAWQKRITNDAQKLVKDSSLQAVEEYVSKKTSADFCHRYIGDKSRRAKSNMLYPVYFSYLFNALDSGQPLNELFADPKFAASYHQVKERERIGRYVIAETLRTGAFDMMQKIYKTHAANIAPVLALLICDMIRSNCKNTSRLPKQYLAYYTDARPETLLQQSVGKFIFLVCNSLTPEERTALALARSDVGQTERKVATIFRHIKRDDTRNALLTHINSAGKIDALFERLATFGAPETLPMPGSSRAQAATFPDQVIYDPRAQQYEEHNGYMYPVLAHSPTTLSRSPESSLPPLLELPEHRRPNGVNPDV
jgi:hypothetical protein